MDAYMNLQLVQIDPSGCEFKVSTTAPGTPLMDAYMNLQLVQIDPSGCEFKVSTTLFLHYYKYTNSNAQASRIQVSTMNRHVHELAESLEGQGWDTNSQNWLILWVSNQPIQKDVTPHSKLLWVGRDNLEANVPLIAPRGLVVIQRNLTPPCGLLRRERSEEVYHMVRGDFRS
jgi:hypothetical protein